LNEDMNMRDHLLYQLIGEPAFDQLSPCRQQRLYRSPYKRRSNRRRSNRRRRRSRR